ncbi:unnamed protein product [Caenorhabditis bovis]|uniref:Copper transport protein n=1 Tax=Caenorhabditis bovis TaxID=2654633 RepID=A0A8S1F8P4_9PELO|nr:unnamed protein product [Caenorhabditis bovis]
MEMKTTMKHMPMGKRRHMWMWYHTVADDTVLFKNWFITDAGTMVWACVLVILAAILLEFIKYLRWALKRKSDESTNSSVSKYGGIEMPARAAQSGRVWSHLSQTVFYFMQLLWGYVLMNIYMTFSVWICLSLCLGLAIGHFIFASRTSTP